MGEVEKLVEFRTSHHCAQSEASTYLTNTAAHVSFRFNNPIICRLTAGMKVMRVGDSEPFFFHPGDAMYVPPDMEIDVDLSAATEDAPIACDCIEIDRTRAEGVLARVNEALGATDLSSAASIRWDQYAVFRGNEADRLGLEGLMNLFTSQRDMLSDLRIETRIEELIIAVLQARSSQLLLLEDGQADNGIFAAARLVSDNLDVHLCTERLAKTACMSHATLHRKFRQSFGLTPRQFANQLRIAQAKGDLRSSGRSIAQIAARLGFTDASHFTRVFRKVVGETPAEYRRNRMTFVSLDSEDTVPNIETPVSWRLGMLM